VRGILLKVRLFLTSKTTWIILGLIGVTRIWSGVIMAVGGLVFAFIILRKGMREQFWLDPAVQAARNWEDVVWSHTSWHNLKDGRFETPEEGIERLAGGWKKRIAQPEPPKPKPRKRLRHKEVIASGPAPCRYCHRGAATCSGHGVQYSRRD
jgi:hypothetical protein